MSTLRCHIACSHTWIHRTVLEIYLSVGKDADLEKKKKGAKMNLFPFLKLSFVSSFILFFYYFLMEEKTISKPIKCQQPLMLILSIFSFSKNIYTMLEKVKGGHWEREREALIFSMFICMCVHMYICCVYVYVYIHTFQEWHFQKKDVSCVSLPSLYNVHICMHTHISINKHISKLHG